MWIHEDDLDLKKRVDVMNMKYVKQVRKRLSDMVSGSVDHSDMDDDPDYDEYMFEVQTASNNLEERLHF